MSKHNSIPLFENISVKSQLGAMSKCVHYVPLYSPISPDSTIQATSDDIEIFQQRTRTEHRVVFISLLYYTLRFQQ